MLMAFFCKCINIKVTKQTVIPIIDLASYFKVMKNESKCDREITN